MRSLIPNGWRPAVLNAANEVAVDAFLDRRLEFLQIAETVAKTMDIVTEDDDSLEAVIAADRAARKAAENIVRFL